MLALGPREVLQAWENGAGKSAASNALALLAAANPEASWDELAALPLGERDRRLLELRARTLGPSLEVVSHCASCDQPLELSLETEELLVPSPAEAADTLKRDDLEVRFRLPAAGDVLALEGLEDVETARRQLVEGCVVSARRGEDPIDAAELSDQEIAGLASALAAADPQAEVLLGLNCPSCGASWREVFDIASFFWRELGVQADRLLRQVHLLARAYGWHEADILALSTRRRQAYLEILAG